jgi:hypothetical protein
MKYIIFFSFFLILSCSNGNKSYVCGDRKCIDKKEFNEYFAKNLTMEIITTTKKKKDKSLDLVKLNTKENKEKEKKFSLRNLNKNNDKKLIKEKSKLDKIRIKEERIKKKLIIKQEAINQNKLEKKIKTQRKVEENKKKNEEKKEQQTLSIIEKFTNIKGKISTRDVTKSTIANKNNQLKNKIKKNETRAIDNSICIDVDNCDIEKITDLLTKEGANKDFPDITVKK